MMFVFAKLNLLCTVPSKFAVGVKTLVLTGLFVLLVGVSFLGPGKGGATAVEGVPGGGSGAFFVEFSCTAEGTVLTLLVPFVEESNFVSTSSILVSPSFDSEEVIMIGGGAGLGGVAAWVTAGNFLFRLLLERNPLACRVWNLDLTESESTIRCC